MEPQKSKLIEDALGLRNTMNEEERRFQLSYPKEGAQPPGTNLQPEIPYNCQGPFGSNQCGSCGVHSNNPPRGQEQLER